MKKKLSEYKVYKPANELNEIFRTEINRNTFGKKYNLSGEYSDNGGIDLYNTISFAVFKPNLGPLVKLNFSCVNTNENGTESIIILKRLNGATYKTQLWFMLFFIILSLIIVGYQFWKKGIQENLDFLIMPIFGIVYVLTIELIAELTIGNLIKRVEKVLDKENIRNKKL